MYAKVIVAFTLIAATLMLAGCSDQPQAAAGGPHCIELSGIVADRMSAQHAVASLPSDARAQLLESLDVPGRLCLSAVAVGMSCNAGGARAPDIRRCCKFSQPPQAIVSGLPNRLAIRSSADPEGRPVVDLELRSIVEDLSLDQRCEVPTCEADRATARPQLQVSGSLTNGSGTIDIDLRIDLEREIQLLCTLPEVPDETP